MTATLRTTPLHDLHLAAGARMVSFAGFEMPLLYTSVLGEHRWVRRSAGLFDVSHMGQIRLSGPQALELAQRLFTNDLVGSPVGRVRYGLLCREDGGTLDDVTVYHRSAAELLFCVNAANITRDLAWMREQQLSSGLESGVFDESEQTALLAVQGPRALALVASLLPAESQAPRRWHFTRTELARIPVWLSRTGYTGEDGYEIYSAARDASALWKALLAAGGDALRPAGIGARDTLRTEMAFPLYGHELDMGRNPIEAGLERFVAFDRGFIGEEALRKVKKQGPAQRLAGMVLEGRQVARSGYPILAEIQIGQITSGTYGPSVESSIAMGYVASASATPGSRLRIDIRGRQVWCEITKTPFYDRKG